MLLEYTILLISLYSVYHLLFLYVVAPFLLNHIANTSWKYEKHLRERKLYFPYWQVGLYSVPFWKHVFKHLISRKQRGLYRDQFDYYCIQECKIDSLDLYFFKRKMQEPSVYLTPSHVENAKLFAERAAQHRLAQEKDRSILPSANQLYSDGFIGKFKSTGPVRTGEMLVGSIRGKGTTTLNIPVVPERVVERYDDRIAPTLREKSPQIVVGAVEIINDGFASVTSDVSLAAAIYDKRHNSLENAFKGAYATRASGLPTHTVIYPMHRCLSTDPVNDSLVLSCTSRDTDFSDEHTLAQVSVRTIYKEVRSPSEIQATRNLRKLEISDQMKALQFAREGEVVVVAPRYNPAINLDNYEVPSFQQEKVTEGKKVGDKMVFPKAKISSGGIVLNYKEKLSSSGLKNFHDHFADNASDSDDELLDSVQQGQSGLMEDDVKIVDTTMQTLEGIPETMRLLHSVSASVALNCTPGTRFYTLYMRELLSKSGVHVQMLNLLSRIPGSLRLRVHCDVSPTCGIGLFATYVEGNESSHLGSDLGRLLGLQHVVWNPSIEPFKEFSFKPFSCCNWWNMHYLGSQKKGPVLTVGAVTTWNQPPKQAPSLTVSLYFEPTTNLPLQVTSNANVNSRMIFKRIGIISLKQGELARHSFEVNFGKPQITGNIVTNNIASAICSHFQYVHSGIDLIFYHLSSPMMTSTFTVVYVPGTKQVTNLQELDSLPSVTFSFSRNQTRNVIRFPREIFPMPQASERWDLVGADAQDVSGVFYFWQRDGATSSVDGDMVVQIDARASGDVDYGGVSAGYPFKGNRIATGKSSTRTVVEGRQPIAGKKKGKEAEGQAVTHALEFNNVFYGLAEWNYSKDKFGPRTLTSDTLQHKLKLRLDGTKNSEDFRIMHSPLVRVLQNCAWFKGTIHFKICFEMSAEYQSYQRTSQIAIDVHENSLSSNTFYKNVVSSGSSVVEFSRQVTGPVEGFAGMGWSLRGDKKFYKLAIYLGNVFEVEKITLLAKFGPDVEYAGQQKATWYTLDAKADLIKKIK
uniref:RNA2 polyprotein n=1 Tax=Many-flowered stoneseed fabavirus TaxID=3115797 RepID=A0AAT9JAW9_9SECO